MKNTRLLLCCSLLISNLIYGQITGNGPSLAHAGSMQGPPVQPRDLSAFQNIVNINGQDGFSLHRDLYLAQYYTVIDGQKVLGIPFLFAEWYDGTITTPDGRVYTDYKLKYNVQNQTVFFMSGKDSLEVNEEIKEFSLKKTFKDSTFISTFVNSDQFQKSAKPVYYEVLVDDERGELLKLNTKTIASSDGTLNVLGEKRTKYLNLESSYFYFDKKTKKLSKIKLNADISPILHLSEQDASDLNVQTYELSHEDELISLIKLYFLKAKLKGF